MESLSTYTYAPLGSDDHIRILELLPSGVDTTSPLCCQLHHRTLEESYGAYEAISYCWGDWKPSDLKPIRCANGLAWITPSLKSILTRLRFQFTSRMLWVDALCINQGDDQIAEAERVQQIGMMHKIFPNANEVIADLGELEPEDSTVFEGLKVLEMIPTQTWQAEVVKFRYTFVSSPEHDGFIVNSPLWKIEDTFRSCNSP